MFSLLSSLFQCVGHLMESFLFGPEAVCIDSCFDLCLMAQCYWLEIIIFIMTTTALGSISTTVCPYSPCSRALLMNIIFFVGSAPRRNPPTPLPLLCWLSVMRPNTFISYWVDWSVEWPLHLQSAAFWLNSYFSITSAACFHPRVSLLRAD